MQNSSLSMEVEAEQTLLSYMEECNLSKGSPGLLIEWNPEGVARFVQQMIHLRDHEGVPPAPPWLNLNQEITPATLMEDIVNYLKAPGGGRCFKRDFVAPNTFSQYFHVCGMKDRIEMAPYMQAVMRSVHAAYNGSGLYLAKLAVVYDINNPQGNYLTAISVPPGCINLFH